MIWKPATIKPYPCHWSVTGTITASNPQIAE
jgi:hypothetical protein